MQEDIAPAIDAAKLSDADALNVLASALFFNNRTIIFDRVTTLRLPAMYQWPEIAESPCAEGRNRRPFVPWRHKQLYRFNQKRVYSNS
jgi:hypothetical protein